MVLDMLKGGADPNDPDEGTPLFMGAGPRSGLRSPLHFAGIYGAEEIARALLTNESGPTATVDQVDGQGHTALYYAALNGNIPLAKLLLAHGADAALRYGAAGLMAGETVAEFARRHRQHAFADVVESHSHQ